MVSSKLSSAVKYMSYFIGLLHIAFFALEMFFWQHPIGLKIFNMTAEQAVISYPLAMQQAVYNGFLAAGLFWGGFTGRRDILVFFFSCVIIAGSFAALTVKPSIFFTQALPAIISIFLLYLARFARP
ncbi:MAG: DUF1304 domain-containing protein [Cellvibrionaceae bacterium]|nr:DUF1304 domain-containing protein [Cellvibrionaceae bacterium]